MNKSYLKMILRFLRRNKTYTILNLACLSFGLSCSIIAVLYMQSLLNHDKFNKNYNRLYSAEALVTYFNGDCFPKPYLSASLDEVLKASAPEAEAVTREIPCRNTMVDGERSFSEEGIFADTSFFTLFSYNLINGDARNVLSQSHSIVITQKLAMKLFGTYDCIGNPVTFKTDGDILIHNVTGVLQDVKGPSVFNFEYVIPLSDFLSRNPWAMDAGASVSRLWVLLGKNADKNNVDARIKDLISGQEETLNQELFLFPLKEHMLYSYANGKRVWREMQTVAIVGSIAFAILLIACFNFINLSVAMNIKRYKEAGIRKTVGASRASIVSQYLGETLFIILVAFALAFILADSLLFLFNRLFDTTISLGYINAVTVFFFIVISLFTAFVSGIIPAVYLSSSEPVDILKGKGVKGHSFSVFRQGLIVFQFTIPVILVIFLLVIKTQDRYIRNFNLGVEQDSVIVIKNSNNIKKHLAGIKSDLLAFSGIENVSFTDCVPSRGAEITDEINWDGRDATQKEQFWCINTDFDFTRIVDLNITSGRYFSSEFLSDSSAYLVNDVAARVMELNDPVGSLISVKGKKGQVIGVFSDFHALDLSGPLVPTIISVNPYESTLLLIKFSGDDLPSVIRKVQSVYEHYGPDHAFQFQLLTDYTRDYRLLGPSKLAGIASFVAILLACFGLMGLAAFTAGSRTKEIGIRKINGATTGVVMRLLLKGYTRWITIASIIAVPVSFFAASVFLGRYYNHTPVPYWAFIAGPLAAYIIALLTVGFQTWRAASMNPVETLRYE